MALGLKLSVKRQKSLEARRGVIRRMEVLFWMLWSGYSIPSQKQAADILEMSLDEINAEVLAVRAERKT